MKIRKLQLKNIGVFDDETIGFAECEFNKGKTTKDKKAEIHIFTGKNGSGKSTLLMGLASGFYGWKDEFEEPNEENTEKEKEIPKNLPVNTERSLFKRFRYFNENSDSSGVGYESYISLFVDEHSEEDKDLFGDIDSESDFFIKNGVDVFGFPKDFYGIDEIRSMTWSDEIEVYKRAISSVENPTVNFAVFAYSGYRFVKSEKVELLKENNDNPLNNSLDFIKTYEKFTINQWIANNLSQRALAREENNNTNADKFNNNVRNLAKIITKVVGYNIDFKLKYSPPQLVLKLENTELDFDVLPDGLRSLLSWIGDLLMRVNSLNWQDDLPIFERNLILLLDEIEVHLHPAWQRKVLPVVQELFKNSQIFVSTHSPFVVNSVDDAWVYKLELEDGKSKISEVVKSENSYSISQVLRDIFEIYEPFGEEVQNKLNEFEKLRDKIIGNGSNIKDEKELLKLAKSLADEPSDELKQIVLDELRQLSKIKGKDYSL